MVSELTRNTFFLLTIIFCALAFGQKPTVAVVMNDRIADKPRKLSTGAYDQLHGVIEELIDSKYAIFDRSDDVQKFLMEEQAYQRSGAVSDNTIKALGEQFGVQWLCIVSVNWSKDSYHLQARLTDIVTRRSKTVTADSPLNSNKAIRSAAAEIANKLLDLADSKSMGGAGSSGGSSGGSRGSSADNTFTDSRDGKKYRTVKIGSLVWMAENLNYRAGNSWCYDNDDFSCRKFGRLYDWETAMKVCPQGWHLPSRSEWSYLVQNAGDSVAGTKLKAKSPSWNGTDDFGFSALPGGFRYTDGSFDFVGSFGGWWTATESGSNAFNRNMRSSVEGVFENSNSKALGFSVRCVKD
ncbi:MAG: fibrobacter succinogenes major paralogous domain-containing protein [Fibromonadaceae bacterium]|jgi:uncharacterized protein (TIGR02145 family)|nr:fibrobacter succinogenes major paralogous domain-containing protein [Fibromonadaceae bacterium]